MGEMDEDLETLIEEVKQSKPELAEAMRQIEAQVETTSDGHEITRIPDDFALSGREKEVFVLAGAFGSALEREYPRTSK